MIKQVISIVLSVWLLQGSSQTPNYAAFGNNFSLTANITALYVDSTTNTLYAGGMFEFADGKRCRGAARWMGTHWDSLAGGFDKINGADFSNNIYRILRYKGKLYYFGSFQQAGNKMTRGMANWTGTAWDSTGVYPNGTVTDADVYQDTLYICGQFTQIGTMPTNYAAKFDGTTWYPMSFPFTTDGPIRRIRAFKNKVYALGAWYANGYSLTAEYNKATQVWQPSFGVQGSSFKQVVGLERVDSLLFFYGLFTHISTMYSPDLVAWSGNKLYGFGIGSDPSNNFGAIHNIKKIGNKIYIMGVFDNAGGMYPSNQFVNIAELTTNVSGTSTYCFSSENFDNAIKDMVEYNGEKIISGAFWKINNDSIKKVAKWLGGAFTYSCNTYFTSVKETVINDFIKLYPNPTNSILNFEDEQNELQNATLNIINALGQTVLAIPYENQVNVSAIESGFYTIKIRTLNGLIYNAKFIKE